jgi:hypothetical protein
MHDNHRQPELITIITNSLLEWRTSSRDYQEVPSNPTLVTAVK